MITNISMLELTSFQLLADLLSFLALATVVTLGTGMALADAFRNTRARNRRG